MPRKSTKKFNIGDSFLSWEVISCENPKKYRYLCRCSCGNERVFYKYNLLKGSFAPCKKCGYSKLGNTALIKKHWNCELNGSVFSKAQDFDLTQSYWFICDAGHNFRSTIKDFSTKRCLSCQNKLKDTALRIQSFEYALQLFRSFLDDVEVIDYAVVLHERRAVVFIIEHDRFTSYRNYYSSEAECVDDMTKYTLAKSGYAKNGYRILDVELSSNFEKNVDSFKEVMLQLVHNQ